MPQNALLAPSRLNLFSIQAVQYVEIFSMKGIATASYIASFYYHARYSCIRRSYGYT